MGIITDHGALRMGADGCQENTCGVAVVSRKTEVFETSRKAVPVKSLFLSYMEPVLYVSRRLSTKQSVWLVDV